MHHNDWHAHCFVKLVDCIRQVRRPEIDGGKTGQGIKGAVKVSHDELALVADNLASDCVEKQRHRELRRQGVRGSVWAKRWAAAACCNSNV